MKVVTPRLIFISAVGPRSILALSSDDVKGRAHRPVAQTLFASQPANGSQSLSGQQARIEYAGSIQRRITETNLIGRFFSSIQIVEYEVTDRPRERQVLGT